MRLVNQGSRWWKRKQMMKKHDEGKKLMVIWKSVGVHCGEVVEGSYVTQGGQGRPLGGDMELRSQNNGGAGPGKSPRESGQGEEMAQNSVLEYNQRLWNIHWMSVPLYFILHVSKLRLHSQAMVRPGTEAGTESWVGLHGSSALPQPSPLLAFLEHLLCARHHMKHVTPFSHLRFAYNTSWII